VYGGGKKTKFKVRRHDVTNIWSRYQKRGMNPKVGGTNEGTCTADENSVTTKSKKYSAGTKCGGRGGVCAGRRSRGSRWMKWLFGVVGFKAIFEKQVRKKRSHQKLGVRVATERKKKKGGLFDWGPRTTDESATTKHCTNRRGWSSI